MEKLNNLKCVHCRGGEPTVTRNQFEKLQPQVPNWDVEELNNVKRLVKIFKFKNFKEALDSLAMWERSLKKKVIIQ